MSALFATVHPSRLAAMSRASTIMGGWSADVPDLPLSSRDVEFPPAPIAILPAPTIIRPAPRIIDETRVLALALYRERLAGWDRLLVKELIRWRREPSAYEADQIAALAEHVYWQARDDAAAHLGTSQ